MPSSAPFDSALRAWLTAAFRTIPAAVLVVSLAGVASAEQDPTVQKQGPATSNGTWTFGIDGVAFATFNRQGGRRGETEFVSQNWVMATASRPLPRGSLTLSAGLSAEPLTVGAAGYSELFQVGEAYRNLQVTDHQHPHDLIMQLAAAWHIPVGSQATLTLAGAPIGEPALGPVAFIHRASSSENPSAPLSHHIFDSTHIASSVLTVRLDRRPFAVEASAFRGREPDEHRYDIELGAVDSWSARVWLNPLREWTVQASHGFLYEPERLEPGSQRRTNGSVSWHRERPSTLIAATAAVGRNRRPFSTVRALLVESTGRAGRTSLFGRFESLTVETEILLFPRIVHVPHPGELIDRVKQLTVGGVQDLASLRGFRFGVGGDIAFYSVPALLQLTHERRPVSYHVFVRVQPPSRGGRMWNMTMGQPMGTGAHTMHHE
jgi:hypothetical protein